MGFEVVFHYCELSDGVYDRENIKNMKKKIGKSSEEVDDVKLANFVMGYMARRDIFVVEVEVYEFVKRKINFLPTKNGVKIKNKNYNFDLGKVIEDPIVEEEETEEVEKKVVKKIKKEVVITGLREIRKEIYSPPNILKTAARKRGFKFTEGKTYPIYEEKPANRDIPQVGLVYKTIDDEGNFQILHSEHFIPKYQGLINDNAPALKPLSNSINLEHGNSDDYVETGMPALR